MVPDIGQLTSDTADVLAQYWPTLWPMMQAMAEPILSGSVAAAVTWGAGKAADTVLTESVKKVYAKLLERLAPKVAGDEESKKDLLALANQQSDGKTSPEQTALSLRMVLRPVLAHDPGLADDVQAILMELSQTMETVVQQTAFAGNQIGNQYAENIANVGSNAGVIFQGGTHHHREELPDEENAGRSGNA